MSILRTLFGLSDTPPQSPPGPESDYWYNEFGAGTLSVRDAMSISAYASGLRYLSETLASLPLHIYERDEEQGRDIAREHSAYSIVHDQPNDYQTTFEFVDRIIKDIHNYGGHVSVVETNAANTVIGLRQLDMASTYVSKDPTLGIRTFVDGATQKAYLDSQVLFIPGPFSEPFKLISTLDVFAETLSVSVTARRYVQNYFSRGGTGPVYAHFPNIMNPDVKTKWADWFARNFGGARNIGRIPVMDGAELKTLNIKHSEMQLLELQRFFNEETSRILRVPQHKMQILDRSTNNNIEHQGLEAVADCLRPLATRIEKRMNVSVLGPRERERFYIEFDLDGLLRGDSQAQASLMSAEIQNSVGTPNEWRRLRNRKRYDDPAADKLYIQGATVPLEMAGQQQQQQKDAVKQ